MKKYENKHYADKIDVIYRPITESTKRPLAYAPSNSYIFELLKIASADVHATKKQKQSLG